MYLTTFFLVLVSICSFSYYIVPNYLFPSITTISLVCLIWKHSILAQQIGSGTKGLGFGALALDWQAIVGFLGTPLGYPPHALMNLMGGFVALVYVIAPTAYWGNQHHARRFPFYSSQIFDKNGREYDASRVLKRDGFELDEGGYYGYSKVYLSVIMAYAFGFHFAAVTASISQAVLFHGREIFNHLKIAQRNQNYGDIHNRLMQKYKPIPHWWYHSIFLLTLGLSLQVCEGFGKQFQLPFWGLLACLLMVVIFIPPVSIIFAITGQSIELNVVSEVIAGYLLPGRPLALMAFKSYGISCFGLAIYCISNQKLAHYMKIPPRTMFLAQVLATIVGSTTTFAVTWWLFSSVKNICHPDLLPKGSPWTCPGSNLMSSTMVMFGIVGPSRVFFPSGIYSKMFIFLILGAISPLPVWMLSKRFPDKQWIKNISFPNIFGAAAAVPVATPVNYWSWFGVGVLFNVVIYRRYKKWWGMYGYIFSIAMSTGVALNAFLTTVALQLNGINGADWWGLELNDHCPLATCPTASDVEVEGCPKFH